ncbi:MAG: type II toxin-antitoxin system HicB family antitoxin [Clostridia bacterium]|nr:type II toxin-antitoxin system HicB family antitoxin [Clostridia bacterium]
MKMIDYYMGLPYRMEIIPDAEEGGFVVRFPDLPGCLTIGNDLHEALNQAEDAKRAWLTAALEDGVEIHEPESLNTYSGQFKLRLPRSLHRALAEHAKAEGISMNQYCLYLLSQRDAIRNA